VAGLLLFDEERRAPVLRPALLVLLGADGPLLAIAHEREAIGLDALGDEIVHRRARTALAEAQVVLIGAALVTVPFDEDDVLGVLLQPLRVRVERRAIARADVVAVEVEMDRPERVDRDEILRRGTDGLG